MEKARSLGKPVLVLIAPDPGEVAAERAHWFAQAWIVGDAAFHADLALCEVACATREQLFEHVGLVASDTIAGWIDTGATMLSWTAIDLEAGAATSDEDLDAARGARNASRLGQALAGAGALPARVAAVRNALPSAKFARVERSIREGRELRPAAADEAAALVRSLASGPSWTALLDRVATERIWLAAPHGARWMFPSCGHSRLHFLPSDDEAVQQDLLGRVDGEPPAPKLADGRPRLRAEQRSNSTPMCGTGHASRLSTTFLVFYTDEV